MSIRNLGSEAKPNMNSYSRTYNATWSSGSGVSAAASNLYLQSNGQSIRGHIDNFSLTPQGNNKFINFDSQLPLDPWLIRILAGQTAINIGIGRCTVNGTHELCIIQLHQIDNPNAGLFTLGFKRANDADWPNNVVNMENISFSWY